MKLSEDKSSLLCDCMSEMASIPAVIDLQSTMRSVALRFEGWSSRDRKVFLSNRDKISRIALAFVVCVGSSSSVLWILTRSQ